MSDTIVNSPDGPIKTNLPPEAVADLQQPVEAPKPEETPAPEPTDKPAESKTEEPKPEPLPEPARTPEGQFKPKPKPIANLLAQKHDAEERATAAEKRATDLEARLAAAAAKPAGSEATSDIKALAAKHGLDEGILADIVATARAGMNPSLPPEVTALIKESEQQKQIKAETDAFNADLANLTRTFKSDKVLDDPKARERLQALAYSEEKAPDGQPYFKKPLYELYMSFVKPEFEPGKPSAEPSRGGAKADTQIMDFQEIFDRDDPKDIEEMDKTPGLFAKYSKWLTEKQGDVKIKRN